MKTLLSKSQGLPPIKSVHVGCDVVRISFQDRRNEHVSYLETIKLKRSWCR